MSKSGRLEAIWLKRMKGGPMDPVPAAELVPGRGLVGNANQGGRRQVTIVEQEAWDELMAELGASASAAARRANLLVSGVALKGSRGSELRIGGTIVEILGETRPCEQMEEAVPGLQAAMGTDWRGGVFGRVVRGGRIAVGDPVELVAPEANLFQGQEAT